MARPFRIGLLQLAPRKSKDETLEALRRLLSRYAREPSLIVMPEYAMRDPTGLPVGEVSAVAEALDGPWVGKLRELAIEYNSCFVATLFERPGDAQVKVYNTAVIIDNKGKLIGVYRKSHLFDAYGYKESGFTIPGDRLFEPVEACGARLGLAICFEIRYPEIFRCQALSGAELVAVPAAWYKGPLKEETLHFLARARAHENTMFIAVASNAGSNFVGRSVVVDPLGVIVADAGPGERYIEVEVDLDEIEKARQILPLLELRRPELYSRCPAFAPPK